ncbi:glycosyltransferase family 2 protein [Mucilaginibacter sp. FT3.2]|uniref:glycosyltransferase family 2 protein n=1 Tax=Mucilaginibacter sp. FT3.2 TaxID=2723090 RepID=UPI0016071195|nr:glycosyltransferase family 2 protein [Mucilaginibacter sp. FT3.2]MBB6231299.1 glycosyltransferase involved in cell wall biosynthesis [Mucilaginibacter sp. FT3.2]
MALKPTFSIIIPIYNAADTIANCLDSIISQHYTDFEVWLIDAVSTDETITIVKEYQSQYPYFNIISEKDKGIYDAMNKGINVCNGEWLYFLGSDDTLYDNCVLTAITDKIRGCDDRVIYGNVIMRGENQWNLNNVIFNGEYDLEKLLDHTINHQAIFYNKAVFEKCGLYDLKYKTNADYDLNLRCYALTTFRYVNIIVANFFVGGQSTNFPDTEFHKDRGALFFKYFGKKIFSKSFINSRLYLQQAALSARSPLNIWKRGICLLAYTKLKFQSILA